MYILSSIQFIPFDMSRVELTNACPALFRFIVHVPFQLLHYSECIVQHIGKCCPECSIPSYAMDAHPNRRIAGLVQQITELKQFLNELAESNIVKCKY